MTGFLGITGAFVIAQRPVVGQAGVAGISGQGAPLFRCRVEGDLVCAVYVTGHVMNSLSSRVAVVGCGSYPLDMSGLRVQSLWKV